MGKESKERAMTIREKIGRVNDGIALTILLSTAVGGTLIVQGHPIATWLPLFFVPLTSFVAHSFGLRGTLLGVAGSAAVMALLLFPPLGHMTINNQGAQTSLAWMLVLASAGAWIFGGVRRTA